METLDIIVQRLSGEVIIKTTMSSNDLVVQLKIEALKTMAECLENGVPEWKHSRWRLNLGTCVLDDYQSLAEAGFVDGAIHLYCRRKTGRDEEIRALFLDHLLQQILR